MRVARILGSIILRRPDARRVGVIGHQHHIKDVMREEGPLGCLAERIKKWSYFGKGDDRASNEWHRECDLLVILGTPRVSTKAVETELVRAGDFQTAEKKPGWGPRRWEAKTPSGDLRVFTGKGYLTEKWRFASELLVKSALLQAVGRARSLQSDGIEAIVLSNEPLGHLVEDEKHTMKTLSDLGLKWAAWFEGEVANPLNNNFKRFCNFSSAEMGEITGLEKDRVSKLLKELADFGYLTKLKRGMWAVSSIIESDRGFADSNRGCPDDDEECQELAYSGDEF